ncbi:MAG: ATP-binding cassette domain-containing protein [Candidatus Aminicenantes bacterium]|nr:ATP-binding cassette domain-containing protein [Candidatus Aminicenantes bacterium]
MIKLKEVSKSYGPTVALHTVDLSIHGERTTVLIGPSGCGKSTLLRLIIGLIQPDTGCAAINGITVSPGILLQLRQRMGYVIQEGGLFPHLTVRRNVTLMALYLGWEKQRIQNRLNELIELTRFPGDRLDCYPLELSGGQRQRVSLMRALMLDPDVLLFDEPLAALDPMIRSELQEDLKRIFKTLKKTVVLVTHDLSEAGYFGDRIVLLKEGRIVQAGTLAELVRTPAEPFVTRFINAQRSFLEI